MRFLLITLAFFVSNLSAEPDRSSKERWATRKRLAQEKNSENDEESAKRWENRRRFASEKGKNKNASDVKNTEEMDEASAERWKTRELLKKENEKNNNDGEDDNDDDDSENENEEEEEDIDINIDDEYKGDKTRRKIFLELRLFLKKLEALKFSLEEQYRDLIQLMEEKNERNPALLKKIRSQIDSINLKIKEFIRNINKIKQEINNEKRL